MLVDYLVYGVIVFGLTMLLNATVFKRTRASPVIAWTLTITLFIVSVGVLSVANIARYRSISKEIGLDVRPKNPIDVGGAFAFSLMFFSLLKRRQKVDQLAPQGETKTPKVTNAGGAGEDRVTEPAFLKSSVPATLPEESVSQSIEERLRLFSPAADVMTSAPQILHKTAPPTTPPHVALQTNMAGGDADESLWAHALAEVDGASRRQGLWAKSFSEAGGNEPLAKATYMSARVAQMQLARLEAKRLQAERFATGAKAKGMADGVAHNAVRDAVIKAPTIDGG